MLKGLYTPGRGDAQAHQFRSKPNSIQSLQIFKNIYSKRIDIDCNKHRLSSPKSPIQFPVHSDDWTLHYITVYKAFHQQCVHSALLHFNMIYRSNIRAGRTWIKQHHILLLRQTIECSIGRAVQQANQIIKRLQCIEFHSSIELFHYTVILKTRRSIRVV